MRVLQNQVHLRPIVPLLLREASQERTTITDTAGSHAPSHSQVEQRRSDNAHTRRDSDRDEFKCGLCREEVREAERMGLL